MVSKAEYLAWEQLVIKSFYDVQQRPTELVPVDGSPSVLSKEKLMLVLLQNDGAYATDVANSAAVKLPPRRSIKLFHCGNRSLDGCSYGVDGIVFKHPAFDIGGLTNYKQTLGSPPDFVGPAVYVKRKEDLSTQATMIFNAWESLGKKIMPSSLKLDLKEFLSSAFEAFDSADQVTLCFRKLPAEHRVLVTSNDVREKTGNYYVRVFGGGVHAWRSDGVGLYCAVAAEYVTPNINMRNLESEYRTYNEQVMIHKDFQAPVRESKCSREHVLIEFLGAYSDGAITVSALIEVLENLSPGAWAAGQLEILLQAIPQDNNKCINIDEFLRWVWMTCKDGK